MTHSAKLVRAIAGALFIALRAGVPAQAAEPTGACRRPSATVQEHNKQLVERFMLEVFGRWDVDAAAKYLKPSYIQHAKDTPGGLDGFQRHFRPLFAKVSAEEKARTKLEILHTVAEGDLVAIHLRASSPGPGGKQVEETWFDLFRIEGDRIAEHWDAITAP